MARNRQTPLARTDGMLKYFALAYALTWMFTIPLAILWNTTFDQTLSPVVFFFLPAPFGPTIAALILTGREEGKAGVKRLLGTLVQWRVPARWYAFALLCPAAIVVLALSISGQRAALAGFDVFPAVTGAPLLMLLALPFGPLAEELGWRGYAQPRLNDSAGLWKASFIIGLAWTFWHAPMFWFPGAAIPSFLDLSATSVALYGAQITAEAVILTFLYVVTRGSVLLAVLYHTAFNTAETVVGRALQSDGAIASMEVYVLSIVLSWIVGATLLWSISRKGRHEGHH